MSKTTPLSGIPTPFGRDGSPPGEDWQEVRDAETGELLAYGRRIDADEAERLGETMQGMPGGGRPGPAPAARGPGRSPARARAGTPPGAALLFGGKPMPAGHFHFALPLAGRLHATGGDGDGDASAPDSDGDGDASDEEVRAERAKARHEQKEQRHRDKMRERAAKVIRNARSERRAHKKAETKRKRIRGSKRSLNRRR